jgi:hypothetical protein
MVLLAGAGVIAAIWSNGTNKSTGCAPFKHAPVPAAAKKALAAYSGRILHDVEHSTGSTRDESWDDRLTGNTRQLAFDQSGRLESEFVTTMTGNLERTYWVLYPAHNVTVTSHRIPAQFQRHGSAGVAELAQANRDKVANGTATIVGSAVIDGRKSLHLHETIHPPAPPPPTGMPLPKGFHFPAMPAFEVDTWVDPLTYLTVRRRAFRSVTDETWLPRTPANIAKTKLIVPAGFKHSVPQQGRGFAIGTLQEIGNNCQ